MTCASCDGDGEVLLFTGTAPCPDCNNQGETMSTEKPQWMQAQNVEDVSAEGREQLVSHLYAMSNVAEKAEDAFALTMAAQMLEALK